MAPTPNYHLPLTSFYLPASTFINSAWFRDLINNIITSYPLDLSTYQPAPSYHTKDQTTHASAHQNFGHKFGRDAPILIQKPVSERSRRPLLSYASAGSKFDDFAIMFISMGGFITSNSSNKLQNNHHFQPTPIMPLPKRSSFEAESIGGIISISKVKQHSLRSFRN